MPFEYVEDEAIADIAFRATGQTLSELFYEAIMATSNLQTDISKLEGKETRSIEITKSDPERLLKGVLDEIVYLKDADLFFVKDTTVIVEQKLNEWTVKGEFRGDFFDIEIHPMWNDLKAITWHDFYVQQIDSGWECYVLIDI